MQKLLLERKSETFFTIAIGEYESGKYWLIVFNSLKICGIRDILLTFRFIFNM
jgi:hypothetical protein